MSILKANLKHLYQRRVLWLVYPFIGLLVLLSIQIALDAPKAYEGRFMGLIELACLIGLLAGVIQMEIVTKPIGFTLPGHRLVVRNFIFAIAIAVNAFGSLLLLFYPGLSLSGRLAAVCAAFFAGMVLYSAGVWLSIVSRQPMAFLGLFVLGAYLAKLVGKYLEMAVVDSPAIVISVGLICSAAMWVYLGSRDMIRSNCMRDWVGFEVFSIGKMRQYTRTKRGAQRWDRVKTKSCPQFESFLLRRMVRHEPLSRLRHVWSALYTVLCTAPSRWLGVLLPAFILTAMFGYMGTRMIWFILVMLPFMALYHTYMPVFSNMLIAGGRTERCWSTMAVVSAICVLISAFALLIVGVSALLSFVLPDVTVRGHTFTYDAFSPGCLLVPLIVSPIAAAIHVLFRKQQGVKLLAFMVMFTGAMAAGALLQERSIPLLDNDAAIASLCGGAWLVFVLVLRRVCAKHCLVN